MTAATKTHDKISILALLDQSDVAVIRALEALYSRQTADELASHMTRHTNGVGFSKWDAAFLTDMVVKNRRWGRLTPNQMRVTREKVKKYWRQLVEIANGRAEVPHVGEVHVPEAHPRGATMSVSAECQCENYDGEMLCPSCSSRKAIEDEARWDAEFAAREHAAEARAFMSDPDLFPESRLLAGSW